MKTMDKYTYANIIIDPYKEDIESLIGKEVYFETNPFLCLKAANEKLSSNLGILVEVYKDSIGPFCVKGKRGSYKYPCIIEKKEEAKYVPFKSAYEFFDAYGSAKYSIKKGTVENKLINYGGIWLKDKETDAWFMVTEIWDEGVVVGDGKLRTVSNGDNEYFTMNDITNWRELLRDYIFLHGSPCGKEVK